MFWFLEVLPGFLITFLRVLLEPLFWVVVLIVAWQYRQLAATREHFFGQRVRNIRSDVLVATGYGLVGGFLGSLMMLVVGLNLSGSGLLFLWPVALLLMLFNPRYLCFAYAGGLVGLSNLLFGFPPVSVPQLMALVAILHLVESLLILGSGHLGATPAYIRAGDGRVVGGFTLQKFWPIPLVALVAAGPATGTEGIAMPEWWPLLRPETEATNVLYQLVPVVAGLGYGDLAVARRPEEKSRLAAAYLAVYSVALLALALLSDRVRSLALAAALFGPLGHELVIALGRRAETGARPLFVPPSRGVRILDVLPGSAAWRTGLRAGDVVLEINGMEVHDRVTFRQMVAEGGPLEVAFLEGGDRRYRREFVPRRLPGEPLGVILVPEEDEGQYLEYGTTGPLGRWLARWWRRSRR